MCALRVFGVLLGVLCPDSLHVTSEEARPSNFGAYTSRTSLILGTLSLVCPQIVPSALR